MMKLSFTVTLSTLAALLSAACAKNSDLQSPTPSPISISAESAKIIGGQEPSSSDDSWAKSVAAIVVIREQKEIICSGTILEKSMILTSAHCVDDLLPQEMQIVFGRNVKDTKANQPNLIRQADTIRINPAYREGSTKDLIANFDLAIVKIRGEIPDGFQPLPRLQTIENSEFHIWPGQEVRLAGYGVSAFNKKKDTSSASGAGQLRSLDKTIAADGKREAWTGVFGNNENGACWADAGGPAMINYRGHWLLWGIISAPRAGKKGEPTCQHGVYVTKVSHWDDWILDTIDGLNEVR